MVQYLCFYGCGKPAQYFVTKKSLPCCSTHQNSCEAIRAKNSNGLKQAYVKGRHRSTWTEEHRQHAVTARHKLVLEDLRGDNPQYRTNTEIKKMIKQYNLLSYKCAECGIDTWNNKLIVLELDHIDGDAHNCKISNLRLVCPNCHSQTDTFRGRSINTGKKKVSDEELIVSLRESPNIRQALINVGLSPRGGNYSRASRLKSQV